MSISKSRRSPKPKRDHKSQFRQNIRVDEYRLMGKISGEPPFKGVLLHKGWKTESVKLPRIHQDGQNASEHRSSTGRDQVRKARISRR